MWRPLHVGAGRADGGGRFSPPSRGLLRQANGGPAGTEQLLEAAPDSPSGKGPSFVLTGFFAGCPPWTPLSGAQRPWWNHLLSRCRVPAWPSHPGAVRAAQGCGPSWVASPPVQPKGVLQL